jgi:hypothetical protein
VIEQQLYPDPEHSDRVVLSWDTEFKVQNISPSEYEWTFKPTVTSDYPDGPDIKIDLPIVKEMGRSEILKYSEKKYCEHKRPEAMAQWKIKIKLKPGVIYTVFVHRATDDKLQGYMTHYVTKITNGMKFTLLADPNLFDVKVEEFYPGEMEKALDPLMNGKKANSAANTKGSQLTRAWQCKISETLLPYQGLQVYWKYKDPTKPNQGDSSDHDCE